MLTSDNAQPTQPWYCIFVQTGHEDKIRTRFLTIDFPHLQFVIPKRQLRERQEGMWEEVLRPLFPGYILAKGEMSETDCFQIRRLDHVIKVLCDETGLPSKIDVSEIQILLKLLANGEVIKPSKAIEKGDTIDILEGPLKQLQGLVVSVNKRKKRAKVLLNFLGKQRTVEIGLEIIHLSENQDA